MKIAIASGKGGTGKTTVATNLAIVASQAGAPVHLLDCDVEEPNCHIFIRPVIERSETVALSVPEVDEEKCTGCGDCAAICQYSAIVCLREKVLTFPELCHGCGGCRLVCPQQAIDWAGREIGVLEHGSASGFAFTQGRLRIGEAMSPPLIRKIKALIGESHLSIIDAPPGTSCPMITAVRHSDFVCLVTEPTPFGLNDLELAVDAVGTMQIPMGVVINRADIGDDRAREYCRSRGVPLLAEIPDSRRVAVAYSEGEPACLAVPEMKGVFETLLRSIEEQVGR
ncbi:MAG: ATP-binding protein [Candidatus Glassbacteria bacterium]|nr:ATP-binding protein [Candidatus Glassbacteria bacterium]